MPKQLTPFPYIFLRSGAESLAQFISLNCSESANKIKEIYKIGKRISTIKKTIDGLLYESISKQTDTHTRTSILVIKRAIYNNKSLSPKLITSIKPYVSPLICKKVQKYSWLMDYQKSLTQELKIIYTQEIEGKMILLADLINREKFLNGLILSSDSLYRNKTNINKKTRRGFLKYLSRMYTKTSPFSTFTQISMREIDIEKKNKAISSIFLNNELFIYFQDILMQIPVIKENSDIRLNDAVQIDKGMYVYLAYTNKREFFRRILPTTLLKTIVKIVQQKTISRRKLVAELIQEKATLHSKKQLNVYIDKLIEYGFLQSDLGIDPLNNDWDIGLIHKLREYITENEIVETIYRGLLKVRDYLNKYSHANSQQRHQLLGDIYSSLAQLDKKFALNFKPQNIIYENVTSDVDWNINIESVKKVINLLNIYKDYLLPFDRYKISRDAILQYFVKMVNKKDSIDLLTFYEGVSRDRILIKQGSAQNKKWLHAFHNLIKETIVKQPEEVNITKELLEKVGQPIHISKSISLSAFLQKVEKQKEERYVLNGIGSGYGRVFSRFLKLFGSTPTKVLMRHIRNLDKDSLIVENTDTSISNANEHPPLTKYKVSTPNSMTDYSSHLQIQLRDIEVYLDENDSLALRHKKNKKKILPINFGLEKNEQRTHFFQFMNFFSPARDIVSLPMFLAINNFYKEKDTVYMTPRILFEDIIILKRKSWFIPARELPQRLSQEQDWSYFMRVNQWKESLGLPDEVFVQLLQKYHADGSFIKKYDVQRADDYKPQYIHFNNPFLVDLFGSIMKRVKNSLEIIEMLPNSSQIDQNQPVTEFCIEWYINV